MPWAADDADGAEDAGPRLRVPLRTAGDDAALRGALVVEAGDHRLLVSLELTAHEELWTNRTGLVVLHPPQVAGAALAVAHTDGSRGSTAFPRAISPHQPVLDIAGLAWRDDGTDVGVRLTGDVFEMEDQRNWTDASFKTYSRPLALPFPYRLGAGDRVVQALEVTARVAGPPRATTGRSTLRLEEAGAFPATALGASTAPDPTPPGLDAVGSAVLVELDLAAATWRAALDRAGSAGLPLDVRAVPDPRRPDALDELCGLLAGRRVERVAAFDPVSHVTGAATAAALRASLARAGLLVPVVGGARSHFTQLNRERASIPADLDGVVFSTTPLFHSLATEQLVESVAVQRTVAAQAVAIAGGRPVHVGPVTLRPRFNDVATTAAPAGARADLADGYGAQLTGADDPRQGAPELAAWTAASAAALAVPGVASLTWFEEWGERGVRTADGRDRPVAATLRLLAALGGTTLLTGESPDGLVWAVGGASDGRATLLVANLDAAPRTVSVATPLGAVSVDVPPGSVVTPRLEA